MRKAWFAVALATASLAVAPSANAAPLVVYGTSDVTDSNLLAGLISPGFATVDPDDAIDYHPLGSGAALTQAQTQANHVDVVLVHSPPNEAPYVAGGNSVEGLGRAVFYNDYVIVGPKTDPAHVLANFPHDAVGAYQAIAAAGATGTATFVSRQDNSGTNTAEQAIWGQTTTVQKQKARNAPVSDTTRFEPWTGTATNVPTWYGTGQNTQGGNLTATNACNAGSFPNGGCYTMVDRGTYLYQLGQGLTNNLEIVTENNSASAVGGESELTNPFHVYINKYGNNLAAAQKFVNYLSSAAFQAALINFPGNGLTAVFPDAFAKVTSSSIPTHATANTPISISATLKYAPPVSQPIAGIPVQLQQSATGAEGTFVDVGAPAAADASGLVTFTPTLGTVTTFYRLKMDTFDSTALASKFSPNTNNALGTQSGRVDADAVQATPTPISTPTPTPSNVISQSKLKAGTHGAFSLALKFPGAGKATITAKATYKPKGAKKSRSISFIATRTLKPSKAGTTTVHLKPGKTGEVALKSARRLKLTITVSFTPTGGKKATKTSHVTVKV